MEIYAFSLPQCEFGGVCLLVRVQDRIYRKIGNRIRDKNGFAIPQRRRTSAFLQTKIHHKQ